MVVYGVSGLQNDADSLIWNRFCYIENQRVHFEALIDMNKNDITNVNNLQSTNTLNVNNRQMKYLQDGNENNDAVNIKQLNEVESNLQNFYSSEIAKVNIHFFTIKPVYNAYSESTSEYLIMKRVSEYLMTKRVSEYARAALESWYKKVKFYESEIRAIDKELNTMQGPMIADSSDATGHA